MKRKILAALLAVVMLMAIAVPAFATSATNPKLAIASTTKVPTINVQMPTEPTIVVNPYKLKVTIGNLKDQQDQIVSPIMCLTNLSDVNVQVGVNVTAKVGTNVTLVNAASGITDTLTSPTAFVQLEGVIVDAVPTKDTFPTSGTSTVALVSAEGGAPLADFLVVDGTAATVKNTLKAGTTSTSGIKASTEKGIFAFKFNGKVANNAKVTWTEKDTIIPTLTFKFTPVADYPTGTP